MPDITKQDVKSRIIGLISENVKEIASNEAIAHIKKIPELERIKIIENNYFTMNSINSDSYFFVDSKNNFVWGTSTWGIDSVGTTRSIAAGEFDPSTRSGVFKREEFRS